MATLSRRHSFRRWVPDIGDNRELPPDERLYFEVAAGLTKEQLKGLESSMREASKAGEGAPRAFAAALEPFIRIVDAPHTIDGVRVETLGDFVALVQQGNDAGLMALKEMGAVVGRFNSLAGPDELFSLRHSGFGAGTRAPSVVKDASATAAPSSGSPTSDTAPSASPTAPPGDGP